MSLGSERGSTYPYECHAIVNVKEHLHNLAQLDHSFDELRETSHMFQPSLRAIAILNMPNLALHVVYRALRKDFPMPFREAFFELS